MSTALFSSSPAEPRPAARKSAAAKKSIRIGRRELTFMLRNLATLVDNGLSLAKSLTTLSRERSLRNFTPIMEELRRQVESGNPFSNALQAFPRTFSELVVSQIRVAEKSGTLAETLIRVASQLEAGDRTRAMVIKKLSYPAILLGVGGLAVTFLLMFVIPVFQQTYDDAGVPLPAITQFLISMAEGLQKYGWMIPIAVVVGVISFRKAHRDPQLGYQIDRLFFRLPLLGNWFRDLCVLQFIEVLGNMLESGFTIVESLQTASTSVNNHMVRRCVEDLKNAVTQGARFSREIDKLSEFFPPVVTQLIMVGERTGNLAKTTIHIRDHLRREIERYTAIMIGTIEPVLTITLASTIGVVVLAIYLPMFDMISAMNGGAK